MTILTEQVERRFLPFVRKPGRYIGGEINQVKKIIYDAGGQSLAVACKASKVQKPNFASIFLLSRQARPGDKSVESGELRKTLDFFDRIDVAKAQRLLEKWCLAPDHSQAILDLQISRSADVYTNGHKE